MAEALSLARLAELAAAPVDFVAASPFATPPYLLIDGSGGVQLDAHDRRLVAAWLRRLPCPTLAIAGEDGVLEACDVTMAEAADLAPLIRTIEAAPIAATILVQLLRATETMSVADGLFAESLAYATVQSGPEFKRWLAGRGSPKPEAPADPGPPVLIEHTPARLDIRLNRPSRLNAISVELRDALVEAFELVAADPSIEAARVSGIGRCFSIGGDLAEFGTAPDPATGHIVRSLRLPAAALLPSVERVSFDLHGACIGAGIELPAFAWRVTASPDAWFQLPELRFGLIPGAGGCISLPRRIGRQRTAYLALSGRRINAATALAWGLVDEISG